MKSNLELNRLTVLTAIPSQGVFLRPAPVRNSFAQNRTRAFAAEFLAPRGAVGSSNTRSTEKNTP
jgi:hypothetical protein